MAQDLADINDAEIYAVGSRSLDRARAFADTYQIPQAFGSYQELAACDELDVIYIATPHDGHYENTLMCLGNKKAVLCEKPLAINGRQVIQMVEESRQQQVFLMEAIWTRFLPQTHYLLDVIRQGMIGEVHSVKADFGFPAPYDPEGRLFNPDLGGGALLDIGIYPLFLSLLILGKPSGIKASAVMAPTGVDIEHGVLLNYGTNACAHLHATLRNQTRSEAFIYGTEGYIQIHTRWHEPPGTVTLVRRNERPVVKDFPDSSNGYRHEALEVMDCLQRGKIESDQLPHQFSRDLMELLDAVRVRMGLVYPQDQG
jgi:predicted dehydrogenase